MYAILGEKKVAMKLLERAISEGLEFDYFLYYEDEIKLFSGVPGFNSLVTKLKERQEEI